MLCVHIAFDSVDLDRCNTLVIGCPGTEPPRQLVGGVNSTPVVRRQEADQKDRASQRLRVSCEGGQPPSARFVLLTLNRNVFERLSFPDRCQSVTPV
eukprot:4680968-Amphidinium_carterae.1